MNEIVVKMCERIKSEAQSVIDCMNGNIELMKCGQKGAVETVAMFENMAVDSVSHLQELVLAVSKCFYQNKGKSEGGDVE